MANLEIDMEKNQFLHEIETKESSNIPYGCRKGVCGQCVVELNDHHNVLKPKTEDEKIILSVIGRNKENHRLACTCESIKSGKIFIDLI
ncbi:MULTISPECIES: 2Fe-2S iron-sulfur cluster-binding protein [Aliivibrio]|uniref:2Fe-2S iron-sulfur cluster binding domain-containing protein n=3 Tax=Vibrionaceae TaxID=641 RepID=A0A4Q5KYK0_9GAMM|nr:2Fe-2S iron-sulfur cluster-binding protein [Aliivibrio sifiae]RYU50892.1 2Fe-2S iron-sulfur cluster binding domain-containing protein [Aliivibrio finisterrensis]PQJ93813.1 hypothetical protein BTO23_06915 [Aliivibrio sifiae]RYU51933.1 2Fe-2S iron-sulfur cluster binding domain-containing protein [Aliivibrio finisterrensis]RYU56834.1 2Fe-2S iron-sulfur cluster binding domain-containing protein [Aliivibrio finisterrensis]RYU64670.1 2Fe-2S iron-sulfur cluster binding domain-containing protein [